MPAVSAKNYKHLWSHYPVQRLVEKDGRKGIVSCILWHTFDLEAPHDQACYEVLWEVDGKFDTFHPAVVDGKELKNIMQEGYGSLPAPRSNSPLVELLLKPLLAADWKMKEDEYQEKQQEVKAQVKKLRDAAAELKKQQAKLKQDRLRSFASCKPKKPIVKKPAAAKGKTAEPKTHQKPKAKEQGKDKNPKLAVQKAPMKAKAVAAAGPGKRPDGDEKKKKKKKAPAAAAPAKKKATPKKAKPTTPAGAKQLAAKSPKNKAAASPALAAKKQRQSKP